MVIAPIRPHRRQLRRAVEYLTMGDPQRHSCDACESFGSTCKVLIRHLTCRRQHSETQVHGHRSANGRKLWQQTFRRGYIEQTFRRVCVRAELLHGEDNQPYLQRKDLRLLKKGKTTADKAKDQSAESYRVTEGVMAPWVYNEAAAHALWT